MEHLSLYVQLSASALTIIASWLYGNKSPLGPWLGIVSQVPWNIIMIHGGLWGLAPVNTMMLVIHTRNLIKWRRDAIQHSKAVSTSAVPNDHRERRAAKAYEIISGGELR